LAAPIAVEDKTWAWLSLPDSHQHGIIGRWPSIKI
jgi:hypothetical protein